MNRFSWLKTTLLTMLIITFTCSLYAQGKTRSPETLEQDMMFLVGGDVLKGRLIKIGKEFILFEVVENGNRSEMKLTLDKVRRVMRFQGEGLPVQIYPVPSIEKKPEEKTPKKTESKEKKKAVIASPEKVKEYKTKAAELSKRHAIEEFNLGNWCEKNGLAKQALVHFQKAYDLDKSNVEYAKKCGYVLLDGELIPPTEAQKAKKEIQTREKIDDSMKGSGYIKFAGIWVSPEWKKFLDNLPDDASRMHYLTAFASLVKRRNAMYNDISISEKKVLHFLAPLEQKRICSGFDPVKMPPPLKRETPDFIPGQKPGENDENK